MSFLLNNNVILTEKSRRGFALVIVLVILTLLAVITVAYLSSMATERATANAFSNKARAEQAAQAGVDSAMGILRDYFKAFPDSVTAWDTAQSANAPPTPNSTPPPPNEGTSLYLRAVPTNPNAAQPAEYDNDLPVAAPGIGDYPNDYDKADFANGNGPNNVNAAGVDNRKIFVMPLVSGAKVKRLEIKSNAVKAADDTSAAGIPVKPLTTSNSANLNCRRQFYDTQGWLGSPPGYTNPANPLFPKPFNVPWVEIHQQDGNPTPYPTSDGGPVVGRYAFWVEDESFRANVSYAGLGNNHNRRDNSQNYPLLPTDSDLLGLMNFIGLSATTGTQDAQNLFDTRWTYPGRIFPESRAFAHTAGLTADNINQLRYLTTSQSSALNLTRHGTQRLNLNTAVSSATLPTDTQTIQTEVDRIVKTLQFHAPNFGQRFFRITPGPNSAGSVSAAISSGSVADARVLNQMAVSHDANAAVSPGNYAKIYFYKTAANIRDYLDTDAFPTCIRDTGFVRGYPPDSPAAPLIPFGDSGDNPVWAIGKDSAPFISECAARYRNVGPLGPNFDMFIDYYIEAWNMSTKDIKPGDLGPNAFIRVSNPTKWQVANTTTPSVITAPADLISDDSDGVSPSSTRPTSTARDYKIDVSGVTFLAGQMTVITTDADNLSVIPNGTEAHNHIKLCPWVSPGKSEYKGHFPTGRPTTGQDVLYMQFETQPNGTTNTYDYETDITFGSDWGYIDCLQGALPLSAGSYPRIQVPYTGSVTNYPVLWGGVLRGNWTNTGGSSNTTSGLYAASLGDPRTNNEQLSYNLTAANNVEQSRFNNYGSPTGGNLPTVTTSSPSTGIIQTLGLPNYRTVRPNRPDNPWPDYPPSYADPNGTAQASELVLTADKAPMAIANATLTSIGQLGDVYDASRQIGDGLYTGSRGGGRSFKIGQHDDRWDGDETSASRTWTAWRLVDIFATTDLIQQPGLININGILRDNGAALHAALTGLKYQPSPLGDPALHASTGSSADLNVDQLVVELKTRLSQSCLNANGTPNSGGTIGTGSTAYPAQTGAGPFWERGELSEIRGFGRTPDPIKSGSGSQLSGVITYPQPPASSTEPAIITTGGTAIDPSSKLLDRGREELFRRLVEMTTTRGNVFTVYAIGQAISQSNSTNTSTSKVTGTHQLKVTFRLAPKNKAVNVGAAPTNFQPATDYSPLKPNDADQFSKRFGKPDHYDIEVLSVSGSND